MKIHTWRLFAGAGVVLGAAAALAAFLIGGCDACVETVGGTCLPMKCNYTLNAVLLCEVLGAFSFAGLGLVRCKIGRRWLACTTLLSQVLVMIALWTPFMGICADSAMKCHTTAMIVSVLGCVICVLCIVAVALADPKRADLPKRGI